MRIIALSRLKAFWEASPAYADAEQPGLTWYRHTLKADWASPPDVKAEFRNASILKDGRVVFNIADNKYRVVVWINLRVPGGLRAVHRNPRSVRRDRRADDLKEVTMDIKPIKTDADYRAALKEIESLMMAETDTPEGERLDVLVTLGGDLREEAFPTGSSGSGRGD